MKRGYASGIAFVCSFLALMCIGLFGVLIFKLYLVEQNIKENFLVEVVFSKSSTSKEAATLLKNIQSSNYCLEATLIDKQAAMQMLKDEMGESIADFLETNPLYNSIQFRLKSPYVSSYSINLINSQIKKRAGVEAIRFSETSLTNLERTLPIIRIIALITVSIISFFAVLVVFFLTRLKLTFDSPKIETLKLFGAKRWFIVKPHLASSFFTALAASLLALLALFGMGYYMDTTYPQLLLKADLMHFGWYASSLVIFSVLFIPLSTLIALIRHLKYP